MSFGQNRLPDAELEVMQALWECEQPASRADIEKVLFPTHTMASTTVLTLLTRLGERHFLRIDHEGRKCLYTSCVSKEEYLANQSGSFIRRLCGGSISALASALCSSGLTKEELSELRRLLDEETRP